jgi:hypothetical protein
MKHIKKTGQIPRKLVLSMEQLRIIVGGDDVGPEPTKSSGAGSCQTTKFGCC